AILSIPLFWGARRVSVAEDLDLGPWPSVLDAGWGAKLLALGVVIVAVVVPTASLVCSLHVHRSPAEIFSEFSPQISGAIFIAALSGGVALAAGAWTAVAES